MQAAARYMFLAEKVANHLPHESRFTHAQTPEGLQTHSGDRISSQGHGHFPRAWPVFQRYCWCFKAVTSRPGGIWARLSGAQGLLLAPCSALRGDSDHAWEPYVVPGIKLSSVTWKVASTSPRIISPAKVYLFQTNDNDCNAVSCPVWFGGHTSMFRVSSWL